MKLFGILPVIILLTANLSAQSLEVPISFSSYKITGTYFVDVDANYYDEYTYEFRNRIFNTGLGYYQPVFSPLTNVTFGLTSTPQIGYLYHGFGDGTDKLVFDFALPFAGTLKFGGGANKRATWPVGFGIGYGYRLNSLMVDGDVFHRDENELFYSFFRPYYFFEFTIDYQRRHKGFFDDWKLQVAFQPILKSSTYDSEFDDYKTNKCRYMSISFIRLFPLY